MATVETLCGEALEAAATLWLEEVGKADRARLEALVRLARAERTRLSDGIRATFPELPAKQALAAFTSFRKRVNDAAKAAKPRLQLRFEVDTRKQSPPGERQCWFTGPDPAVATATRYSEQVTGDVADKKLLHLRGFPLAQGKRVVRFFLSYAHDERRLVDGLLGELKKHCSSAQRYAYEIWSDGQILLGAKWRASIDRAIKECDFGLLLVSPAFLGSEFIKDNELPHFVGGTKVLPVALDRLDQDEHDLRGLEEHQIFFSHDRSFGELQSAKQKRDFAFELFKRIQVRLDAAFYSQSRSEPDEWIPVPDETPYFQRMKGFSVGALSDLERLRRRPLDEGRDALQELEAWARNPNSPPFFALLGEYGFGKTTTLKQLTRDFLERRQKELDLPLPIYIDLREYVPPTKDAVPTIEELLSSIIKGASWKARDRGITAESILRLVREEGALLLFDGLDERIVHLDRNRAKAFIRTLWSALPDISRSADPLPPGKRRGKFLISCRSHYFPDVTTQNAMLVGEDREGVDRSKFPAFCLMPFSEGQIRDYLRSVVGDRADATFELIGSIHDLTDLARRPYLLRLIVEHIAELEEIKARGEQVNAASLYELLVQRWLNRDDGKHQIEPAHKRRLMEVLAAEVWRSGKKEWSAEELEAWFDKYRAENPAFDRAYATKDSSLLKEDLRTATFILRPDTEQRNFRFAHTSLQEYFLASYLARALDEGRKGDWALPMVSDETLEFLGQKISLIQSETNLRMMEEILGGDSVAAATLAFRYWLRASQRHHPSPSPTRVNLTGADLEDWEIRGHRNPLNLRGANLSEAKLNRARVENIDLTEANLDGLKARQALFLCVSATRVRARGADLTGLRWRGGTIRFADFADARTAGCHLIEVDLTNASLPEEFRPSQSNPSAGTLALLVGHAGLVRACAVSHDSQRLLSASDDHTLKVWDAASGECRLTLLGHAGSVRACTWSPDGKRLLSGSDDETLKIWDASSGECVLTLSGHAGPVRACAWSPDGKRLLSGSDDILMVWDASSGECLLTLSGHADSVWACAWSPDGKRLLSGSLDDNLKVWDASSGECVLTLSGHTDAVRVCAWSPDGKRILSGSDDKTFKVWDAASGEYLRTLSGYDGWVRACAWSPDGKRILSGSLDGNLKVWDASSGEVFRTRSRHAGWVWACAWSPDGKRLFSGSDDGTLKVWDASSGECLLTLSRYDRNLVWGCVWSPDGKRLCSGSSDGPLKVWDAVSGECLLTLSGHVGWVWACAWSPDSKRIVSGSDDALKIWDAVSGECLLTLPGHAASVWACAWSLDGQCLLSGSADGTLKVWDAGSGECLLTVRGHAGSVRACAWSPDGQRLLSGSDDNTLKVWDVASEECLLTLSGHAGAVRACAWSPNGQRILSGSHDDTLKIWDASSGECLLTLSGHADSVWACAWSPDSKRLLSGSVDDTLKIWDASSGECLLTLSGHADSVRACAWSPDGQRLLSGSDDSTLKVWEAASGECLWTGHLFPEGQTASIDEARQRILHASPEAWRWLGWRVRDPETGDLRILPYV